MTIRMLVAYVDHDKAHEEAVKFCIQVGGTYSHPRQIVTLGKLEWFFLSFASIDDVMSVAGWDFQNAFISQEVPADVRGYLRTRLRSGERFLGLCPQVVVFDDSTGEVV